MLFSKLFAFEGRWAISAYFWKFANLKLKMSGEASKPVTDDEWAADLCLCGYYSR